MGFAAHDHEQEKRELEEQFGPSGALESGKVGLASSDVVTGFAEAAGLAGKAAHGPALAAAGKIGKVGGVLGAGIAGAELIHDLAGKGGPRLEALQHGADLGFSIAGLIGGPVLTPLSAGYSLGGLLDTATGAKEGELTGLSGWTARAMTALDPFEGLRERQHREEMKTFEKQADAENQRKLKAQFETFTPEALRTIVGTGKGSEASLALAREVLLKKHGVGGGGT